MPIYHRPYSFHCPHCKYLCALWIENGPEFQCNGCGKVMQFRRKSSGRGLKNWYVQEMDKEFPEILPWPRKKSKPHPKPRLSHHGEDPFPPGYGSRQWLLERGMDLDQNTEPSQLKEILTGRSRKPERG